MRRFLTISFITLALVVGAAGAAPAAHAETAAQIQANIDNEDVSTGAAMTANAAAAKTPTGALPDPGGGFGKVMTFIMSLFAWLLAVAVITLDNAVFYTVVTMGDYVSKLPAIGLAWSILRDLGNIILIFGFLAIGICVILDVNWYGGGTKMLPKLLLAAVFLNFSLFISEAVIDTGNLFATQFYTQINGGQPAGAKGLSTSSEGISNKIMSQLGLATMYGNALQDNAVFTGTAFIGFMGIIVFIVAAFVMFSLAFILIARFIILIFLIILAPIGFAGLAVPQLSGTAQQWWSELFKQTIMAPILLLLLYIALRIITAEQFLLGFGISGSAGSTKAWTGFIGKNPNLTSFASVILSFIVAMGFLLAVVIFTKKLGAFGAGWATKMGGRLSFGAVSLGARATLGSAGNLLASKRMQSWARKNVALRPLVLAGKGLRSSTFDLRNAPGAAAGLGKLGIEAGKGATITAKQAHEAQYGVKPVREWFQQTAAEREQAGREIDFKKAQSATTDAQNKIKEEDAKLAAGTITQAQYDANVSPHKKTIEDSERIITSALSKMSTKQLEELSGIKKGVEALVTNLSPQQFEALMKSDKLNDVEKGKIKETRYQAVSDTISGGSVPDIKKAINSLSKGELESIPTGMLTNPLVLENLSDKQRETITDSKERTAAEKTAVRNASPTGKVEMAFRSDPMLGPINAAKLIKGLSSAQVAKLPRDILSTGIVAAEFKPADLIAIQEEKKLTSAEMIAVGNAIRASSTASAAAKNYVTPPSITAVLWS